MTGIVESIFGGGGAEQAALGAGEVQAGAAERGIEQLDPFREAGLGALEQQQALLGLGTPEQQQQALSAIQETPGQQFIRQRQQRALLRGQSAIGGLGGGNVRTALQEQGAGFAQQDLARQQQQLAQLIGGGQQAAVGTGQLLGQAGQARASGILGAQQARAQGMGSLLQTVGSAGLGALTPGVGALQGGLTGLLSDETMKQNIQDMTPEDCMMAVLNLDIKAWEYLPQLNLGESMHIGPMAQSAPECIKIDGKEMLDLHSELMLIAGAMQYLNERGFVSCQ